MVNIHNLAGRIANLYYDYDYYDFNDSLEVGETMEDAIFKIERVLSGKGGADSYIDFMDEIIDNIEWEQTEDPSDPNYGGDMLKRAKSIRNDLYSLKDGWIGVKNESLQEDTVKQGNSWVNKGKEGTHGKFKTKKGADAQRKAMFANGFKEDINMRRRINENYYNTKDVLELVSNRTRSKLNKIINDQKNKYGNDMEIEVIVSSPYKAHLNYGEGGADFIKTRSGEWEHDYGYIKINKALANDILNDVCAAVGLNESYRRRIREGSSYAVGDKMFKLNGINLKDWYTSEYPDDELGYELNDDVDLRRCYSSLGKEPDIYDVMGVGDSLIRERVFAKMADVLGVDYDVIYRKWLDY